jgi:adenylate kinase
MLNVIISGAPGCGKGTQSELIVKNFKLKHFSTGDLLRSEIAAQSELGKAAEEFISKGNLVPDQMIIDMITAAIDRGCDDCGGVLLDGFPRTREQAESLESMMDRRGTPVTVCIDLQVPEQELIQRLLMRGETSGRSDDNLETIKKRLEVYQSKTKPVNDYYQSLNKYVAIDGVGSIEEIFGRIEAALGKSTK